MSALNPWRTPDSRLVLRYDAPRQEWLEVRRLGLGGSDVSGILGFNKYSSAYKVWLTKTGQFTDDSDNQAMRMGRLLEPVVKQIFTEDTGIKIRNAGLHRSKQYPWMQVSLDGLTADGGIFEAKTTSGWLAHEWEDDQVPDHAELQVQHGMAVTGRSHAWVTGLIDGRWPMIRRIERDEKMIKDLVEFEEHWWKDYVLALVEPPLTPNALPTIMEQYRNEDPDKTVDMDPEEFEFLRANVEAAKQRVKDAEAEKDLAEAQFRVKAGNAEIVKVGGHARATLKSTGTFASSKFATLHPGVAEKYTILKPAIDTKALAAEENELYNNFRSRVLRFTATPKEK